MSRRPRLCARLGFDEHGVFESGDTCKSGGRQASVPVTGR